jgi:hypothetical protein
MSFFETSLPTAGRRNAEIGHYGETLNSLLNLSQDRLCILQRPLKVTLKRRFIVQVCVTLSGFVLYNSFFSGLCFTSS